MAEMRGRFADGGGGGDPDATRAAAATRAGADGGGGGDPGELELVKVVKTLTTSMRDDGTQSRQFSTMHEYVYRPRRQTQ